MYAPDHQPVFHIAAVIYFSRQYHSGDAGSRLVRDRLAGNISQRGGCRPLEQRAEISVAGIAGGFRIHQRVECSSLIGNTAGRKDLMAAGSGGVADICGDGDHDAA